MILSRRTSARRAGYESPTRASFAYLFLYLASPQEYLAQRRFIHYLSRRRQLRTWVRPRWNPLERVQTYTHPLWMLGVSAVYFVVRDMYFAPVALSIACSAGAIGILMFEGLNRCRSAFSRPSCSVRRRRSSISRAAG